MKYDYFRELYFKSLNRLSYILLIVAVVLSFFGYISYTELQTFDIANQQAVNMQLLTEVDKYNTEKMKFIIFCFSTLVSLLIFVIVKLYCAKLSDKAISDTYYHMVSTKLHEARHDIECLQQRLIEKHISAIEVEYKEVRKDDENS